LFDGCTEKKNIMKQTFFYTRIVILSLFIAFSAAAQIGGNATIADHIYNGNSDYLSTRSGVNLNLDNTSNNYFSNQVEANVMINVKATSFVAIFSLSQHGKTVDETEAAMHQRVELFKTLLKQADVNNEQVFIDPVSMIPTYATELTEKKLSKTYNEVPTGFEMKKNIHISFKQHAQINQIISIAAKAEVYDLVKVDYTIDQMDQTLEELRQEALRILLDKKKTLEKAGINARFSQLGEKYGSAYPVERYAQYYAYKTGTPPSLLLNYKKGQPVTQVSYNYAEKNKTAYYEKVSDKQFDRVINPVVGEPMVQVYLTLKAQYTVFDPATETEQKKYNDRVREIQLREMELNLLMKERDLELKKKK
jgi:hypothetical protein